MTPAATTTDNNPDEYVGASKLSCQDVLLELFWYIKHKRTSRQSTTSTPTTSTTLNMTLDDIVWALRQEGILFWRDPRFNESKSVALSWVLEKEGGDDTTTNLEDRAGATQVTYPLFAQTVTPCARLFLNAFNERFVIPDWTSFTSDLQYFFEQSKTDTSGQTAQYIPILRDAEPDRWGVSVCSVDGQRVSMGHCSDTFSLQSVSKPVTYAMGLTKEGEKFMDDWIDVEPAGRPFNTQDLDPVTQRPFNASVNSGAIMSAGCVASGFSVETDWKAIVNEVRATWRALCGGDGSDVGFSQETFDSEKSTAYNNFAIAYNLKGRRGLPRDVDLHKMLDVYLGCCSIEITTEALSVAAATLANGGVCPITEQQVFPSHVVRSVLAETMTCGMYDQAGRFAVQVGLPAKSGVSGALMVMVPNLLGFATFSPRLNAKGNSVRGIDFCKRLVRCYRLHIFEPLHNGKTGSKIDPRQNGWKDEQQKISLLAWAASVGDEEACRMNRIFLVVLCTTSAASEEGLSDRRIRLIKEKHRQVFLADVSDELFNGILNTVREDPNNFNYLEHLIMETPVTDTMTDIIFSAVMEIATSGETPLDPNEREVATRIASMTLGMSKEVAELELKRYAKRVGHRFETHEIPDMIDNVRSAVCTQMALSIHAASTSSLVSFGSSVTSLSTRLTEEAANVPLIAAEEEAAQEEETAFEQKKEEAFKLHKQIVKLRQRLSSMRRSDMPQSKERRKVQIEKSAKRCPDSL